MERRKFKREFKLEAVRLISTTLADLTERFLPSASHSGCIVLVEAA